MLVLGACEQHGYLSLLTDAKIPKSLAEAASEASGVLLAPPLNFGCSPYFLSYPGTISLRLHTYLDLVEDILRSLYGAGFRKVLILNGHGGNTPVRDHLVELANELPDLMMRWYAWWTRPIVTQISQEHDLINQHANWEEAFDFTIVSEMPKETKPVPNPAAISTVKMPSGRFMATVCMAALTRRTLPSCRKSSMAAWWKLWNG